MRSLSRRPPCWPTYRLTEICKVITLKKIDAASIQPCRWSVGGGEGVRRDRGWGGQLLIVVTLAVSSLAADWVCIVVSPLFQEIFYSLNHRLTPYLPSFQLFLTIIYRLYICPLYRPHPPPNPSSSCLLWCRHSGEIIKSCHEGWGI